MIFDLDETLVSTIPRDQLPRAWRTMDTDDYDYAYEPDDTVGFIRPYCKKLLDVSFKYFDMVGIWTAGSQDYASTIVPVVFGERTPSFVWTREESVLSLNGQYFYKPLSKLWQSQRKIDIARTIIVDDRLETAIANPANLILMPKFRATDSNAFKDVELLKLAAFIKEIGTSDVDDYAGMIDKRNWIKDFAVYYG